MTSLRSHPECGSLTHRSIIHSAHEASVWPYVGSIVGTSVTGRLMVDGVGISCDEGMIFLIIPSKSIEGKVGYREYICRRSGDQSATC